MLICGVISVLILGIIVNAVKCRHSCRFLSESTLSLRDMQIIRFAFLLTDESLTYLAKQFPDLLDYSDANGIIDYNGDVNDQLYKLFGIDDKNQQYVREVLTSKE